MDNINITFLFFLSAKSAYIIMITKRSCHTEDWSNDAENSGLPSQK